MKIIIDILRLSVGFFLQTFPYMYLCIFPFRKHIEQKRPMVVSTLYISALAVIYTICCLFFKYNMPSEWVFGLNYVLFMFLFILCVVYYCIIVRSGLWEKLFVVCFVAIFAFFVSLLSTMVWHYIREIVYNGDLAEDNPYSPRYVILLFVFTAASFPLALWLIKTRVTPLLELLEKRDLSYMSRLTVGLLIMLSGSYLLLRDEFIETPITILLCLTLCSAVAGIYIVVFGIVDNTRKSHELRLRLLKAEYDNSIADEQYRRICENIESQRQARHNFRQQLITLRGLCDSENGDIRGYLSEYLSHIPEYSVMPLCPNPILNPLLSYYKTTAENEGFVFECNIELPAELHISEVDLVTILGNLLENALDAGRLIPKSERRLIINIGFINKMLGIAVDNTFNGAAATEADAHVSTKHKGAALGLQSINNIACKYGGHALFTHEGNMFYASVMLSNLPKSSN